jgi:hypothetical protein
MHGRRNNFPFWGDTMIVLFFFSVGKTYELWWVPFRKPKIIIIAKGCCPFEIDLFCFPSRKLSLAPRLFHVNVLLRVFGICCTVL